MENYKTILSIVGVTVLLVFGGAYLFRANSAESDVAPGLYQELAQCITDSGAKFYGAWWCPHCQDQKAAFGDAVDAAPYVECSTPDGQGQTEVCAAAEITSYPTWEFAGGERVVGNIGLKSLAEVTSCPFPEGAEPSEA